MSAVQTKRSAVNSWLPFCALKPRKRVRLFCFHHAGGGASVFHRWTDELPDDIEVWPVQLPGRETRLRERPINRMAPLVKELVQALSLHLDMPFALFGHSMGAHVAFEFARELRRAAGLEPVHLFVAGHQAPHRKCRVPPVYGAPDGALMDRVHLLAGTPREVLAQPGLMQIMLPILRADLEIVETYQYVAEEPLRYPISAFWAHSDIVADEEEALAWSAQTTDTFKVRDLEGDHFFVHSSRHAIQRAIREDLMATLGDVGSGRGKADVGSGRGKADVGSGRGKADVGSGRGKADV